MAQYNKNTHAYLNNGTTLFEAVMLADRTGVVVDPRGGASAVSAFNEPISVPITPIIQLDSLYGLDPREFQTFSNSSGEVEATGTLWKCHTGETVGGYSVVRSNRVLRYRPGQGAMCRFTAAFDNPQTGVTLRAGFFAQEQALNIGFDGTQFGVLRQNGGKAHITELVVVSGGTGNVDITLNGVTTSVAIASTNVTVVAKTIADTVFPGWTVEQCDDKVRFLYNSITPLAGAFTVAGAAVGNFNTLQEGNPNTNNWTYQTDFNLDKLDGTGPSGMVLDTTKLNIFQISFRWLGAGQIRYGIEDSNTGEMIFFHREDYSNRNTDVHLDNPSFRLGYIAANLTAGPVLDAHITGASMMGALEGVEKDSVFSTGTSSSLSSLSTGSTHHLLSAKNAVIHSSRINLRKVKLKTFTCSVQANDPVIIHFILNGTKSTGNTWNKVADFSGVIKDTATGTYTLTNEHELAQFVVPIGGSINIDLDALEINIPPGSHISIAATSGQTIQSIVAALNWIEV